MEKATQAEEIRALEREWCARLKAKDVDWIVELFDAEGVQLPPGSGPVAGREALRAAWHALAHTEGLERDGRWKVAVDIFNASS